MARIVIQPSDHWGWSIGFGRDVTGRGSWVERRRDNECLRYLRLAIMIKCIVLVIAVEWSLVCSSVRRGFDSRYRYYGRRGRIQTKIHWVASRIISDERRRKGIIPLRKWIEGWPRRVSVNWRYIVDLRGLGEVVGVGVFDGMVLTGPIDFWNGPVGNSGSRTNHRKGRKIGRISENSLDQ
jgi:hypothetical protein